MAWNKDGTISVSRGSANVAGAGTQFLNNASPGDVLLLQDQGLELLEIRNAVSQTSLRLAEPYTGATRENIPFVIIRIGNQFDLMSRIEDFLRDRQMNMEEFRAWCTGSPDGGEGGRYPLTDRFGQTVLAEAPETLSARVDGAISHLQSTQNQVQEQADALGDLSGLVTEVRQVAEEATTGISQGFEQSIVEIEAAKTEATTLLDSSAVAAVTELDARVAVVREVQTAVETNKDTTIQFAAQVESTATQVFDNAATSTTAAALAEAAAQTATSNADSASADRQQAEIAKSIAEENARRSEWAMNHFLDSPLGHVTYSYVVTPAGAPTPSKPTFQQLSSDRFEPPYLTPRIIHPRPLAETQSWARSRLTLPNVPWEIPVGVVGLSKPIGYSVEGPAGMEFVESFPQLDATTGEFVEGDKSGYLRWANPTQGTHQYTIHCRGQDGRTLSVTSELKVSSDNIRVLTPSDDIDALWAEGNGNFQLWLRGGDYAPAARLSINGPANPKVLLGFPGETVNIDMRNSQIVMDNGEDVCFSNLNFADSNPTLANSRFIYGTTNWVKGNRFVCYDVSFSRFEPGTVGDDNPGPITVLAPGAYRDDFYLTGISLKNVRNTPNTSALGSLYQLRNGLIDRVTIGENVTATRGVFLKSACRNFAVHRVTSVENLFLNGAVSVNLTAGVPGIDNDLIEVAWCKLSADDRDSYVIRHQGGNTDPGTPNVYIYRNNLRGRLGYGGSTSVRSTVYINRNVITSSTASPIQPSAGGITVIPTDNLVGNQTSGYLDANMRLAGEATTYLGQRGAQHG